VKCPNCQTENPDTAAFCNKCGSRLVTSQPAPPVKEKIRGKTMKSSILLLCSFILVTACTLVLAVGVQGNSVKDVSETASGLDSAQGVKTNLDQAPRFAPRLDNTIAITVTSAYTAYQPSLYQNYSPGTIGFGYGVQAYQGGDTAANVGHIQTLGLDWVELHMLWKNVEPSPGSYDWSL
jgi:hypothetical protein